MEKIFDVIVIGGGQSGLACGYYLRRSNLNFLILDKQERCGGSWQQMWESLTLFSPAKHSSLPGWLMPETKNIFPSKEEVVEYLCKYETRYKLPVKRPVDVLQVIKDASLFKVITSTGEYFGRAVISATGTWEKPVIPDVPERGKFRGLQLHSNEYINPVKFQNKKVLVVGEGNSGAQILAEVTKVTSAKWATLKDPAFLPDDVDGKVLFNLASAKYKAQQEGKPFNAADYNLGNIVMVPAVKEARERDVLNSSGTLQAITRNGIVWQKGEEETFDVIIWCTGFLYATDHLKKIATPGPNGKVKTKETKAQELEDLWLVGYGGWTGYASATLIGVGRTARQTVNEIKEFLK